MKKLFLLGVIVVATLFLTNNVFAQDGINASRYNYVFLAYGLFLASVIIYVAFLAKRVRTLATQLHKQQNSNQSK